MTENPFVTFLKKYGLTEPQIIEIIKEFQKQFTQEAQMAILELGWHEFALNVKVTTRDWVKAHEQIV